MKAFLFCLFILGCSSQIAVKETDRLMAFKMGQLGDMPVLMMMYSSEGSGEIDKILFYAPNATLVIVAFSVEGEWFMKELPSGKISPMGKLPDTKPPPKGGKYESG
jgi:hypothetical protein